MGVETALSNGDLNKDIPWNGKRMKRFIPSG
jgi:hypothetical protein